MSIFLWQREPNPAGPGPQPPTVSSSLLGSRCNIGSISSLGGGLSCVHHPGASLGPERWSPLSRVLSPGMLFTPDARTGSSGRGGGRGCWGFRSSLWCQVPSSFLFRMCLGAFWFSGVPSSVLVSLTCCTSPKSYAESRARQ